jgi:hypothetical protein
MIDDIVFQDVQYVEIKVDSITVQSPTIIIFGADDSTDYVQTGGGESISIF